MLAPNAGVGILGTDGDDGALNGTSEIGFLYGLDGDDVLDGMGDDDQLDGGKGSDTMTGGTGADAFVWASLNDIDDTFDGIVDYIDTVTDFRGAADGDMLNISDLLVELGASAGSEGDFFAVIAGTADDQVELQIDIEGGGAVFGFQTIAFIESGAGLNEANLLTDVINNIEFSVA